MTVPEHSGEHDEQQECLPVSQRGVLERFRQFRLKLAPIILLAGSHFVPSTSAADLQQQKQVADNETGLFVLIDLYYSTEEKVETLNDAIRGYERQLKEFDERNTPKMCKMREAIDALLCNHLKKEDVTKLEEMYQRRHRSTITVALNEGMAADIAKKAIDDIEREIRTLEETLPADAFEQYRRLLAEWNTCACDANKYMTDIETKLTPLYKKKLEHIKFLQDLYDDIINAQNTESI